MSFRTDSKLLRSNSLLFFLFFGLVLRVFGLFHFPNGLEGDEAVVVYWGRKWIQEGQWVLVASGELPPWETPAAYFFGALDLVGIPPRWGAVALSFVEVGLCYVWCKRRALKEIALLAAAFLSLMPWHFFFSFVLGPCVAGLWTSLYLMDFKGPLGRILVSVGGLLYYASFRLILIWGGLRALIKRNWQVLIVDILAGLVVLGALLIYDMAQFKAFFTKGSYLFERGFVEALHHYLNAFVLWWVPPLQIFWQSLSEYSMDDVGYGMASLLVWSSPLSYGISVFFAIGLFQSYSFKKYRDLALLFCIAIPLLGFSPGYVHFPFILPVVAFISAMGANFIAQKFARGIYWIYGALLIGVLTIMFMIGGFHHRDSLRIFSGDSEKIQQMLLEYPVDQVLWTVGLDYPKARLAAHRSGIPMTVFGTDSNDWLMRMHLLQTQYGTKWVFIQGLVLKDHPRPEVKKIIQDGQNEYFQRLKLFENNNFIKSKKTLTSEGIQLGVLYELGD